ncbi:MULTISPECIES: serine hydrolase [unclassified Synechococcus]|uniref:serine hydrolase domain-containing protein n=1 Tax=unclassified Synechococcus TaxID=2626047 RepID=UPI0020CB9694|nr:MULTISPECIES: serine hydrolase domain-containing protein [unclassified Synechococcus]
MKPQAGKATLSSSLAHVEAIAAAVDSLGQPNSQGHTCGRTNTGVQEMAMVIRQLRLPARATENRRWLTQFARRVLGAVLAGCLSGAAPALAMNANKGQAADQAQAAGIVRIVRNRMAVDHLRAVIVRVTIDGKEIVTEAMGESMTGVPATKDMHFRNGAVAISYVATLLLQLVDENRVSLDDKLATWLPEIPNADRVTLGQLAQMTSGYRDYVIGNDTFDKVLLENPFRQFAVQDLLSYADLHKLLYEPGTSWNYAHTNYILLGLALEKITDKTIPVLMQERIFTPLALRNTLDPGGTPRVAAPVLHAFSSERRQSLGIAPGTRFYEESTYWNPSWTITRGAVQYTNIHDMATSAEAIGTGRLLSPETHRLQIAPKLRGFGTPIKDCATCATLSNFYTYGIGIVLSGPWLLQNPLFSGQAGVMAYLPSKKIAIAVAVTFDEEAFDPSGEYGNSADDIFRAIGAYLAPDEAPPVRPQANAG